MRIFVSDNVNIDELCKGWNKGDGGYIITSSVGDEFCFINESTREVTNDGYIGMITDYIQEGIMFGETELFTVGYLEESGLSFSDNTAPIIDEARPPLSCIYPVVTLCGSTRFKEDFERVQKELTLSGYIVIPLAIYSQYDETELTDEQKQMLIEMQYRKIDISDEIYVINKYGYIGSDTMKEIEYAESRHRTIRYMEDNNKP